MKHIWLLLVLALACVTIPKIDYFMPSSEAGYPSAELSACGQLWHGAAICPIPEGTDFSSLALAVQTYGNGTLTIDSDGCAVHADLTYSESKRLPIPLSGPAKKSCLISLSVYPRIENAESEGTKVHSFRGQVAVKVLPAKPNEWRGLVSRVATGQTPTAKLWVGKDTEAKMVRTGCGVKELSDEALVVTDGFATINAIPSMSKDVGVCLVEGVIRSRYPDLMFTVLVITYDSGFSPLPIPEVLLDGGTLTVKADAPVSQIGLDASFSGGNEATFHNFDRNKNSVLRIVSLGGRSALGEWQPKEGNWRWMN
jgi:hypothetical protein